MKILDQRVYENKSKQSLLLLVALSCTLTVVSVISFLRYKEYGFIEDGILDTNVVMMYMQMFFLLLIIVMTLSCAISAFVSKYCCAYIFAIVAMSIFLIYTILFIALTSSGSGLSVTIQTQNNEVDTFYWTLCYVIPVVVACFVWFVATIQSRKHNKRIVK